MSTANFHCQRSDLDNTGAVGIDSETGTFTPGIVVVLAGDEPVAYLNACPHTGVSLEWLANHFLDDSGEFLVCATHGALFRVSDGFCVAGPCRGDSLTPLTVHMRGDEITVLSPTDQNG